MMSTPRKLKMALMMMAGRAFMQRVVTQVAMELGASVQPFTKITPRVSRTVIASIGFDTTSCRNSVNEKSTYALFPHAAAGGARLTQPLLILAILDTILMLS